MGLDSGAMAVILPDEYEFKSLPNNDIISLGLANYFARQKNLEFKNLNKQLQELFN